MDYRGGVVQGRERKTSVLKEKLSSFGFRVSGFGFRVSGFRFQVSGFGFRVSDFGFRVSDFGFQVPGFGYQVSGFGFRVSGLGAAPGHHRPHRAMHPPPPRPLPRVACVLGSVFPYGGARTFHQKSSCLTELTLGPDVEQIVEVLKFFSP